MRESEDFFETARSESVPDFELLCSEIGFVLHKTVDKRGKRDRKTCEKVKKSRPTVAGLRLRRVK